jgi:transcriptional regulator with XRE-family HTH domain
LCRTNIKNIENIIDLVRNDSKNKKINKLISDRIKNRMSTLNLSQSQLSDLLNESLLNINEIENGFRFPNADELKKLSIALKTTTDYLLGVTDNPSQENIPNAYFTVSKKALEMGIPADVLDSFLEGIKNYKKNDSKND